MPEATANVPFTKQEKAFFDAIDRLVAGKPTHADLKAEAADGGKADASMTNVALEAGYARTYLYKNRKKMARVFAKLGAVNGPPGASSKTADLVRKLRHAKVELKHERDIAIDAARRCMQELDRSRKTSHEKVSRLEAELAGARRRQAELEAENASLRAGGASNVVSLKPKVGRDG